MYPPSLPLYIKPLSFRSVCTTSHPRKAAGESLGQLTLSWSRISPVCLIRPELFRTCCSDRCPTWGEASGSSASRRCAFGPVMLEQHIKQHAMHSQTVSCMLVLFLCAVRVITETPQKRYPENMVPTTSICASKFNPVVSQAKLGLTGPSRRHLT
jgi:hypothetical protein